MCCFCLRGKRFHKYMYIISKMEAVAKHEQTFPILENNLQHIISFVCRTLATLLHPQIHLLTQLLPLIHPMGHMTT